MEIWSSSTSRSRDILFGVKKKHNLLENNQLQASFSTDSSLLDGVLVWGG